MSRDIPAIDAIIVGLCSSHDEPNAAEQAIAFDQSLERCGWSIVRTEEIERLQWALREIGRIAPGAVSGEDDGAILAMRMACIAGDALRTDGRKASTVDDVPSCGSENDWRKATKANKPIL